MVLDGGLSYAPCILFSEYLFLWGCLQAEGGGALRAPDPGDLAHVFQGLSEADGAHRGDDDDILAEEGGAMAEEAQAVDEILHEAGDVDDIDGGDECDAV